ncbi:uncharacterized protein [Haliotis asinina]|uniref:uncharacterized protein n=1 Tax=Haliotis asinina TaxID=109174 RepID=UPI0035321AC0
MKISIFIFFLVVFGVLGVQAGRSGPKLADRVAVMEEEFRSWKIVTVQAKTKRSTLARRMRLAFAEINSLKSSLQNTKTHLKIISQELRHVRRERGIYRNSLGKLRGDMIENVRALQLSLTNGDLATKQQITGLTQELMTLNISCCGMRQEADETGGNESSLTTSSLSHGVFTTATTTYSGPTTASTDPSPNSMVPPVPVAAQDLQASTTDASEDLTPSKTVPLAPVTTKDSDDHTTPSPARGLRLYHASMRGDLERVKRILAAGHVNINYRGGVYSRTPVMWAARNGHREVVEFLVGRGADVSLVDRRGYNVLHLACLDGDLEAVKLILDLKVLDVNARDNYGNTAADWARVYRLKRVMKLLVSHGAH